MPADMGLTRAEPTKRTGMLKNIRMAVVPFLLCGGAWAADQMDNRFVDPPDTARPGVYWYFLDGNLNGKEMTADLEAMKAAGLAQLEGFREVGC
jgi:hypothetical protein